MESPIDAKPLLATSSTTRKFRPNTSIKKVRISLDAP
jgi:hypothetical protein